MEHVEDQPEVAAASPLESSTGNLEVDAVLAGLGALDEAPVGEHVAVFEAAHATLRATLQGASEPRGGGGPVPAALRPQTPGGAS